MIPQLDPDALDLSSDATLLDSTSAASMEVARHGGVMQDMGLEAEETWVHKLDPDALDLSSAVSLLDSTSAASMEVAGHGGVMQAMGIEAEETLVFKLDPDALDLSSAASLLDTRTIWELKQKIQIQMLQWKLPDMMV